jgi:hypothetical protein
MLGTVRKVEITLEDTGIVESHLATRQRIPKVPNEVRRAGAGAVSMYSDFCTRQRSVPGTQFVVEHIELATS